MELTEEVSVLDREEDIIVVAGFILQRGVGQQKHGHLHHRLRDDHILQPRSIREVGDGLSTVEVHGASEQAKAYPRVWNQPHVG